MERVNSTQMVGAFWNMPKNIGMILTNTIFNHRMCQRTTCTAPDRITDHNHHDRKPRRKPDKKQIHYILIKNTFRRLVHNSKLFAGFEMNSDHKAVLMNMKLAW